MPVHPERMPRRRPTLFPLLLCASVLLGGCAGTAGESGRSRFVAPRQLAEAYSETELRAMLALTPDVPCADRQCEAAAAYRRQVRTLGERLSRAARELRQELGGPLPPFHFLVPAKGEIGTLSSAAGSIVVFDGLRSLELEEPALAFLIAREMGHVVSRHHDENSATSMAVSLVATLVMPVATILRGAAATVSAVTSTSAAATAATTAASFAGARIIKSIYRPEQLREADLAALKIVNQAGWPTTEVAAALGRSSDRLRDEGWMGELLVSAALLKSVTGATEWAYVPPPVAEAFPPLAPGAVVE